MSLPVEQQIIRLLESAIRPLIVFRKNFSGDSIAAALALGLLLQKVGKDADIVCDGFSLPENYQFLPHKDKIKPELGSTENDYQRGHGQNQY